jgi:7-carboxy-7-deazaguanine synthase
MRVHEIFESIQGEGPVIGIPSLFIRLYGCNLKCDFCDTTQEKFDDIDVETVITTLGSRGIQTICWTGGEPTMQLNEMLQVIDALKERHVNATHIVETNGTIINADIIRANKDKVSLWVISPKDDKTAAYWITVAKTNKDLVDKFYLKFVVDALDNLPDTLGSLRFYVQPKLKQGASPIEAFKLLIETLWDEVTRFPNIVILPQLHKIMEVK